MPEVSDQSRLELQNQKILDAISKSDVKPEDIDQISADLSTPEKVQEIRDITKEALRKAWETLSQRKWPLTPREQKIIDLYNRLFAWEFLQKTLTATNKPSGSLSGIMNPDGTVNTESLKNLSPDQIKEKIGKMNKADIKLLVASINSVSDGILLQTIKQVITPFVETMVANGYSIEGGDDISFLENNGSEKTKQIITEWKKTAWEDAFKEGKKYIIKGEKIIPLTTEWWALTKAGIDVSKINTVDPKAGAEQLKRQLPAWFDSTKFGDMVKTLLKSDSKLFKGLGEILKIFCAFLGIDLSEKKEASKEKLSGKQKRELLVKMGKKNDDYDITSFFDTKWDIIDKKDDPGFKKYLADIDKILWPGALTKSGDGKLFVYDKAITELTLGMQEAYKIQPKTGKLDASSIAKLLEKMDSEWRLIEAVPPQAAPAPVAAPEKPPEAPKHKFADLYEWLKNKTSYEDIKNDTAARKLIQSTVWVTEDTYGPKTKAAVKEFQVRELSMQKTNSKMENFADWFFWPKTIALLKAKIDKETPPPAKK